VESVSPVLLLLDELFDVEVVPETERNFEEVLRDDPLYVVDRFGLSESLLTPLLLEPEDFWVLAELELRFDELFVSSAS
jgi:hypothetical protein